MQASRICPFEGRAAHISEGIDPALQPYRITLNISADPWVVIVEVVVVRSCAWARVQAGNLICPAKAFLLVGTKRFACFFDSYREVSLLVSNGICHARERLFDSS